MTSVDRGASMNRRKRLGNGQKSIARGSTFSTPRSELKRNGTPQRRRPISPATEAQRSKVRHQLCIVCAQWPVHPAHVIDRSLAPSGGGDPRAVVPLCPRCHREYDEGGLSILEYLEPRFREELAYAVEMVGLLSALKRITNEHWEPVGQVAA